MKNRKLSKRGFTVIEIMVVIMVISLLTLLATPKYLTYTKDAKVRRMQSDLSILSTAVMTYQVDKHGNWPIYGTDLDGDGLISDQEVTPVDITSYPVFDVLGGVTEAYEIDESKLTNYVQKINGEYDEYMTFILGPHEAKVFHKNGLEAGDLKIWYGIESQFSEDQ